MNPNISEFSYGYAVTEDLIRWLGHPAAAPFFPTLAAEGMLGFDVKLTAPGMPLFLQFKLSHRMVRNSVVEISRYRLFPPNTNFYRFHLRPRRRSDQHELLIRLEAAGNEVRYAAPAFHQPDELNRAYLARQVRNRSVFVRPSMLGPLPDDGNHHVAFIPGGPAYQLTEPRSLDGDIGFPSFAQEITDAGRDLGSQTLATRIESIVEGMMTILREQPIVSQQLALQSQALERVRQDMEAVTFAAYLSRAFFDCQLLLIGT